MSNLSDLKALERVVVPAMANLTVPGVAVGILHEKGELTAGFGTTNIDSPQAVDDNTLFKIGSTTKTFTGTAVMQLVEDGLVDLHAPVIEYLPKFRVPDELVAKSVTVWHLLTHMSGWRGDYFEMTGRGDDALRRMVGKMAKGVPQLTPLGSTWAYNNAGFYVAGRIIEIASGKTYEQFVKERVLAPLGMEKSLFFAEEVMTHRFAVGHVRTKDGLRVARPWGLSRGSAPAGALASTAIDQLKWARFHMGDGRATDGTRLLSRSSLKLMQRPQAPAGSMAEHVGITWLLDDRAGVRRVKHGGTVNGQMSAFAMVPARGFAVTVLTNGDRGHELDRLVVNWALKRFTGASEAKPVPARISAKRLLGYAGEYKGRQVGYIIGASAKGLVLDYVIYDKNLKDDPDVASRMPPPARAILVKADKGIVLDGPSAGGRLEFVRDDEGGIAWLRFGGRLYKREK